MPIGLGRYIYACDLMTLRLVKGRLPLAKRCEAELAALSDVVFRLLGLASDASLSIDVT